MSRVDACATSVHYGQFDDPGVVAGDRGWRDRAVCRGVDPELFFPVGTDGPGLVQVAAAKTVCGRCPVVGECLSFALVALPEGVAGGLTPQERSALRAQHRRRCAGGERAAGLPAGVDGLVVAELMAGRPIVGASRQELAVAAVGLHRGGRGAGWIATRLGVDDQQVRRWVQRHRAGQPLIGSAGRPGGGPA